MIGSSSSGLIMLGYPEGDADVDYLGVGNVIDGMRCDGILANTIGSFV